MGPGDNGERYDFCEGTPAVLSGYVYHDASNDGRRDNGEAPIPGTKVELIDASGAVIATTVTDSTGYYKFEGLLPGTYSLRETQPIGYLDGLDTAGTISGATVGTVSNPGDVITTIVMKQGQVGLDYNFGELRPSSLAGHVYVDNNENNVRDADESWLAGVLVKLLDTNGNEVARTTTNAQGQYRFDNLRPGVYTVVEEQPVGYFEGAAIPGSLGGNVVNPSRIGSVTIPSGVDAVDYDFNERTPAEISGAVYVDRDGNCEQNEDEPPIAGVKIDLYDATGQIIASTFTDDLGRYRFVNLPKGVYTLRETQPVGFFQGGQCAGSGGGDDTVDDEISRIPITFGDQFVEYNFHELEPASLSGIVWSETDRNFVLDANETRLAGVTIELLDADGKLVQTTTTDSRGEYRFADLKPGTYAVRERQPSGLFHGKQIAGSLGGNATVDDLISSIVLVGGAQAVRYDFAEFPPATISGVVFQDGDSITLKSAPSPEDLRKFRDGILKPGDKPIGGVVLELRNVLGEPFTADRALPGMYPDGPIRVVTAADGTYEFTGCVPAAITSIKFSLKTISTVWIRLVALVAQRSMLPTKSMIHRRWLRSERWPPIL